MSLKEILQNIEDNCKYFLTLIWEKLFPKATQYDYCFFETYADRVIFFDFKTDASIHIQPYSGETVQSRLEYLCSITDVCVTVIVNRISDCVKTDYSLDKLRSIILNNTEFDDSNQILKETLSDQFNDLWIKANKFFLDFLMECQEMWKITICISAINKFPFFEELLQIPIVINHFKDYTLNLVCKVKHLSATPQINSIQSVNVFNEINIVDNPNQPSNFLIESQRLDQNGKKKRKRNYEKRVTDKRKYGIGDKFMEHAFKNIYKEYPVFLSKDEFIHFKYIKDILFPSNFNANKEKIEFKASRFLPIPKGEEIKYQDDYGEKTFANREDFNTFLLFGKPLSHNVQEMDKKYLKKFEADEKVKMFKDSIVKKQPFKKHKIK
jgi:hypothetical protein